MVQIKNSWIALLLLGASSLLGACLDDNEKNYSQLTIGTIQVIEGNDYFFQLDPGSKMYPGDTTRIHNYPLKHGQRAFINFDLLDEKIPGYDYNAVIYQIENILTKDIIRIPSDEVEENIGKDRINITNIWLSEGFINIQYQFFYDDKSDKKHLLNLVVNENKPENEGNTDYLTLEFRRNGYNEHESVLGRGLASFRLDNIMPDLAGKKGILIRYHSLYEGEIEKKIDFTK